MNEMKVFRYTDKDGEEYEINIEIGEGYIKYFYKDKKGNIYKYGANKDEESFFLDLIKKDIDNNRFHKKLK